MIFLDKIGHLISDKSLEELHLFANKIGLRREWFQNKPGHPHYDLTSTKKKLKAAIAGAVITNPRTIIKILKEAPFNSKKSN